MHEVLLRMAILRIPGRLRQVGKGEKTVRRVWADGGHIARMRLQDALREGVVGVVVLVQILRAGGEAVREP